jgi:hypothetical protein
LQTSNLHPQLYLQTTKCIRLATPFHIIPAAADNTFALYSDLRTTALRQWSSCIQHVMLYSVCLWKWIYSLLQSFSIVVSLYFPSIFRCDSVASCDRSKLGGLPGKWTATSYRLLFQRTYHLDLAGVTRGFTRAAPFVMISVSYFVFEFPCFILIFEWLQAESHLYYLHGARMLCPPLPMIVRMIGYFLTMLWLLV